MLIKKFNKRAYLYPLLLVIFLWILIFNNIMGTYENDQNEYIEKESLFLNKTIEVILKNYHNFSEYVFLNSVNKENILEIINEANFADESRKQELRNILFETLKNDYELIEKYNFPYLHFHLSEGVSFLRFNNREIFGDNLIGVRETVRIANQQGEYSFAFEEGNVFSGFRFVYPLKYLEKNIGSVEVSLSLSGVIESLNNFYNDNLIFFVINKSTAEKVLLEKNDLEKINIFGDYVIIKEFYEDSSLNNLKQLFYEKDFLNSLSGEIEEGNSSLDSFGTITKYKDKNYISNFIPIKDSNQVVLGYFVSVAEADNYYEISSTKEKNILILNIICVLLYLLLIFFIKNRVKTNYLAQVDYLTDIYNRYYFTILSEKEVNRSIRYGSDLSLIIFDIDYFKKINDNWGHGAGDLVLKKTARIVQESLRNYDIFARWGGEEFIILLPETGKSEAFLVAERLRMKIEFFDFPKSIKITASFGVSELSQNDKDINDLIKRTDKALYLAKNTGRNRVESINDTN